MKVSSTLILAGALLISGCASVEMASQADSAKAKQFSPPSKGNAGVYVYRDRLADPVRSGVGGCRP